MTRFFAQRHFGSLRPVDDAGADALRRIAQDDIVSIELKRPRNVKHHRMFYALMNIVYENSDRERYPTLEDVIGAVKIAAGLRTRIALPNGDIGFMPGSISFSKMDQTAFGTFYERVCDLIAQYFLPGIDRDDLRSEVEAMIGIRDSNSSDAAHQMNEPATNALPRSAVAGNTLAKPRRINHKDAE